MPILLEPKKTPIVLAGDTDKPEDQRPTFYIRGTSFRQQVAMVDPLEGNGSTKVKLMAMLDAVRAGLVGWEKMYTADPDVLKAFGLEPSPYGSPVELPYNPDHLDLILSGAELKELLEVIASGGITRADRKN